MANQNKNGEKPQLKIQDLQAKKNPQGGARKAGKGQSEAIKVTIKGG